MSEIIHTTKSPAATLRELLNDLGQVKGGSPKIEKEKLALRWMTLNMAVTADPKVLEDAEFWAAITPEMRGAVFHLLGCLVLETLKE